MKRLTIQDAIDHVADWHIGPLSESEQHAIHEVCAYGATYDDGVTPEAAAKMVHGTPYPLPKRKK